MKIGPEMVKRALPILLFALSFPSTLSAQNAPPEPSPTFSSESKLVLVPFNVVRDSHFIGNIQPSDIILLQDGKPREFTVFEGPEKGRRRPPAEVAILFDTTRLSEVETKSRARFGSWNHQATYAWVSKWTDDESRSLLLTGLAQVLISIYRFDHQQLQQLCPLTSDPQTITRAIQRLVDPIPPEEAIPLVLPPNRETIEDLVVKQGGFKQNPKNPIILYTPSWTLEAAIGVLKHAFSAPGNATRLLAVFSQGKGPTTTTPQDVVDQAIALGVPVYPVLIGPNLAPVTGARPSSADPNPSAPPCDPLNLERGLVCQNGGTILLHEFGKVGELTGGRAFYPGGIDEKVVSNALIVVRNQGLFQYMVGFVPQPSDRARNHKLEIKLKSKFLGALRGGRRSTTY